MTRLTIFDYPTILVRKAQAGHVWDWLEWLMIEQAKGIARGRDLRLCKSKNGKIALCEGDPGKAEVIVAPDTRPGMKGQWRIVGN